jgi:hypothetical protein
MDWAPFVDLMVRVVEGDALLVNLLESNSDGGISDRYLVAFAHEAIQRIGAAEQMHTMDRSKLRQILYSVVFDPPGDESGMPVQLQYLSRLEIADSEDFVSFLTWEKLKSLVPRGSALQDAIDGIVDPAYLAASDSRPVSSVEMMAVAQKVNELGPADGNFRVTFQSLAGVPFSLWMTASDDHDRMGGQPRQPATRARDWLGLGHVKRDMQLFLFRSKRKLSANSVHMVAARPTLFDGITNAYFKYKRSNYCPRSWGRALDLAAAKGFAEDCDGGPEVIIPGPAFADLFTCEYVGLVEEAPLPSAPYVIDALLGQPPSRAVALETRRIQMVEKLKAAP